MNPNLCLLMFVKAPEKGVVKTRLAKVLGEDIALELYEQFVRDVLTVARRGSYERRICFHPEDAAEQIINWLGRDSKYLPQKGTNLGERMKNAFEAAFLEGFQGVALIGSDSPDLPPSIIDEALSQLPAYDAVIGPAYDGGYYLLGFNSETILPDVFEGMEWGTSQVFDRTMQIFAAHRLKVYVLPRWRDIDTYEDVAAFMREHEPTPAGRLLTLDFLRACEKTRER
jgi:uncharacterized protein